MCCIQILRAIPFFMYRLFWYRQQGISVVGAPLRRTWGVVLVYHNMMYTKTLIYDEQHIFSYRIQEAVNIKSLPLKIGPHIDLVCPSSSFFSKIIIDSSWMAAITWPFSIRRGGAKLPSNGAHPAALYQSVIEGIAGWAHRIDIWSNIDMETF